jgi:hypothetical protein
MPNQHTIKVSPSVARKPTSIKLSDEEAAELAAGAAALGETISATLRTGGLTRARRALAKQR